MIDVFSFESEWIIDLFVGTTTIAYAFKKGRHCVYIEKDTMQTTFVLQRIMALQDLSNADQEMGAKFSKDNKMVLLASTWPYPPLKDDLGDFTDLEEEKEPALHTQGYTIKLKQPPQEDIEKVVDI